MQRTILSILGLLAAVPISYLIAWMSRDELIDGRKWFKVVFVVSGIFGILFLLAEEYAETMGSFFILIVGAVSYYKSFDKKWTKAQEI